MELTDGTITLRPPVEADADGVAARVLASLPELAPWMPWATEAYDTASALAWVRREIDPTAHPFLIVDDTGAVVGSAGINKVDGLNRSANLGYWLSTGATGYGYATRATRLIAHHGLDDLGLHRIEVVMAVENTASRAVAERAGATYEGIQRGGLLLGDVHHDAHQYSFVAGDSF